MDQKPLAVIALSGGMDSCVTAAIAQKDFTLAAAHFNYGQRTEKRELAAFHAIADFFDIQHRIVIDYTHFTKIGHSSLTDYSMEVTPADINSPEVPSSYVPFRNANILAACTSYAEAIEAGAVFIGAVYEDASGYPDCRPEFIDAFQQVVTLGTKPGAEIRVYAPLLHFSKEMIVKKGIELGAPLHLSWSCYQGEHEACGVCDSCALRLRGFRQAGVPDPIPYKLRPEY